MLSSACDARICPIGAASGGQPDSARMRTTSVSVSSRRSPAAWARRWTSSAATSPAGRSYSAARTAIRGATGATGSSPMCSSIRSAASHSVRRVDTRVAAEPVERIDERLAGDAVERQRQRVDGGGDQVGADARRDDRVEQPRSRRPLDEQPDGQARLLADALDELLGEVRQQRVGRVVDDHARRTERGDLLRPLDERVDLAGAAGAVDEPDVELLARRHDRLARLLAGSRRRSAGRGAGRRRSRCRRHTRRSGARCPRRRGASRRGSGRAAPGRAASSSARRSRGCAPTGSRRPGARPSRTRRRPRPRGTRTRPGRGSRRSAAPRRSAACPRAGPATAGGWWCRRSWASAGGTLAWPEATGCRGDVAGAAERRRPRDRARATCFRRARCSGLRSGRP